MDENNIIDQYEVGGERLRNAVKELTREDMLCVPDPKLNVGMWSIQQVVIHLVDSDLVLADRMKRVIAEDNPQLIGYDETRFAQNLFYNEQPVEESVQLLDLNRKHMVRILRKLPQSAFSRKGQHNERGPVTLSQLLEMSVKHLEHHIKFIVNKREAYGKVMW